jgi:hypothetical protein
VSGAGAAPARSARLLRALNVVVMGVLVSFSGYPAGLATTKPGAADRPTMTP